MQAWVSAPFDNCLYGDITSETGFSDTLTAKLTVSNAPTARQPVHPPLFDPDDAWQTAPPLTINAPITRTTQTLTQPDGGTCRIDLTADKHLIASPCETVPVGLWLWLQVKVRGEILTAVFDTEVLPPNRSQPKSFSKPPPDGTRQPTQILPGRQNLDAEGLFQIREVRVTCYEQTRLCGQSRLDELVAQTSTPVSISAGVIRGGLCARLD